jgi:hypothetical protein
LVVGVSVLVRHVWELSFQNQVEDCNRVLISTRN